MLEKAERMLKVGARQYFMPIFVPDYKPFMGDS